MNQEITSTAPSRQPGRGRVVATALGLGAALGVPVMWAANLGAAPSQADPDTTDVVTSDTGVEPPSTGEVTPTTGEITETTDGTWVTIEIQNPDPVMPDGETESTVVDDSIYQNTASESGPLAPPEAMGTETVGGSAAADSADAASSSGSATKGETKRAPHAKPAPASPDYTG